MSYQRLIMMLLMLAGFQTWAVDTPRKKTLEGKAAIVKLSRIERPEAEPVSKPYAIVVDVECKKPYKQVKKQAEFPVCDTNLTEAGFQLKEDAIVLVHYEWDSYKSSNNLEGANHCIKDKKLEHSLPLSDFCQKK